MISSDFGWLWDLVGPLRMTFAWIGFKRGPRSKKVTCQGSSITVPDSVPDLGNVLAWLFWYFLLHLFSDPQKLSKRVPRELQNSSQNDPKTPKMTPHCTKMTPNTYACLCFELPTVFHVLPKTPKMTPNCSKMFQNTLWWRKAFPSAGRSSSVS